MFEPKRAMGFRSQTLGERPPSKTGNPTELYRMSCGYTATTPPETVQNGGTNITASSSHPPVCPRLRPIGSQISISWQLQISLLLSKCLKGLRSRSCKLSPLFLRRVLTNPIYFPCSDAQTKGIWVWDDAFKDFALVTVAVLAMLGDNPMQSDFSCHIGLMGKFFCRICLVKGKDALEEALKAVYQAIVGPSIPEAEEIGFGTNRLGKLGQK
jgi:hypothetical protein